MGIWIIAGSFFTIYGFWAFIMPIIHRFFNDEIEINLWHYWGATLWKGVREPDEVYQPHIAKYIQSDVGKAAEKLDKGA